MNIDLLVTPHGEAGLLASENLVKKAVGAILDTQSGVLSLEYVDMDHMDLNIPVEEEFFASLDACAQIHIGSVKDGKIAQAYQVPLMFLNDPYRADAFGRLPPLAKPLAAFQYFVKNCVLGQPVHRDDAGNEDTLGCILGETAPSSLEFAQHLVRRLGLETRPAAAPHINAPGMGLGGSSSGGHTTRYGGHSGNQDDTGKDT